MFKTERSEPGVVLGLDFIEETTQTLTLSLHHTTSPSLTKREEIIIYKNKKKSSTTQVLLAIIFNVH